VLAQRLIRVLCPDCKVPYEAHDRESSPSSASRPPAARCACTGPRAARAATTPATAAGSGSSS
jgi:type II secretory ATPase GspE/PulE/Tfp pilus assembly ATPase PilB-like protein